MHFVSNYDALAIVRDDPNMENINSEPNVMEHTKARLQKRYLLENDTKYLRKNTHSRSNYDENEPENPRPFDHMLKGSPPERFQARPITNAGKVNSIRDIIDKGNAPNYGQTLVFGAIIPRNGQRIRFGGTYRHYKSPDASPNANAMSANMIPQHSTTSVRPKKPQPDPFYAFKPQKMSDINLLATRAFRFAPTHQTAILPSKRLAGSALKSLKPTTSPADSADLYQRLIATNNLRTQLSLGIRPNARAGPHKTAAKPLSIMLDVYPLRDYDSGASTDRPPRLQYFGRHPNAQRFRQVCFRTYRKLSSLID